MSIVVYKDLNYILLTKIILNCFDFKFIKMQNLLKFYMEKMKLLLHSNTPDADNRMDELE